MRGEVMEKQRFNVSSIEKNLENSIIASHKAEIDGKIISLLKTKSSGDNFAIPTVDVLAVEEVKGLDQELISFYNSKMSSAYSDIIPPTIKLLQAALMDSLMFGLDSETGKISLYTLNIQILFGLSIDGSKLTEKCFEKNQLGILHAYRIDIDYLGEKEFLFKPVSIQRKNYLYVDRYYFFPYYYIRRGTEILKTLLDKGCVMKITQETDDLIKERFITNSKKVLQRYSDLPDAVNDLSCSYYPLKGYFYAPVVGAPSTTVMVSKVNLFNLSRVENVRGYNEITVEKPVDPIRNVVTSECIVKRLEEYSHEDEWEFLDIMNNLPNGEKVFKDDIARGMLDISKTVPKYLHTLTMKTIDEVADSIPGCRDLINMYMGIFNKNEYVNLTGINRSDLRRLLSEGVYRIVWMSTNCNYSCATVTNNRDVLAKLYGKDYFGKYEGQTVRLNELRYRVQRGYDIEESLKYCGFPVDEDLINAAEEFKNEVTNEESSDIDVNVANVKFKKDVSEATGSTLRAESDTASVLSRTCFAICKGDGTLGDFYRYITLGKVVRMVRIA